MFYIIIVCMFMKLTLSDVNLPSAEPNHSIFLQLDTSQMISSLKGVLSSQVVQELANDIAKKAVKQFMKQMNASQNNQRQQKSGDNYMRMPQKSLQLERTGPEIEQNIPVNMNPVEGGPYDAPVNTRLVERGPYDAPVNTRLVERGPYDAPVDTRLVERGPYDAPVNTRQVEANDAPENIGPVMVNDAAVNSGRVTEDDVPLNTDPVEVGYKPVNTGRVEVDYTPVNTGPVIVNDAAVNTGPAEVYNTPVDTRPVVVDDTPVRHEIRQQNTPNIAMMPPVQPQPHKLPNPELQVMENNRYPPNAPPEKDKVLNEQEAYTLLRDPSPDGDNLPLGSLETPTTMKVAPMKINGVYMRRLLDYLAGPVSTDGEMIYLEK